MNMNDRLMSDPPESMARDGYSQGALWFVCICLAAVIGAGVAWG